MVISIAELTEKHYSQRISGEVTQICHPLNALGIIHFMYSRFFKNGSAFCLTNHWDSYYNHCKKKYIISPPISKNIINKKFFYIPTLNLDTKFSAAAYDWQSSFSIGHPIYFIEYERDYFDLIIYGAKSNNPNIINVYLSNIEILEQFKIYFKDNAKKLIEQSNKNRIWLPGAMSANMTASKQIQEHENFKNKILKQLEIKRYIPLGADKKILLSNRELDTMKQLSLGCTLKEAAKNMNISPRTVETHLNHIRQKLGVFRKSDIIKLLSDFF